MTILAIIIVFFIAVTILAICFGLYLLLPDAIEAIRETDQRLRELFIEEDDYDAD